MQLRTTLLASGVGAVLAAFVGFSTAELRLTGDHSGYQPAQPIAYSHRVHAGENPAACFCRVAKVDSVHRRLRWSSGSKPVRVRPDSVSRPCANALSSQLPRCAVKKMTPFPRALAA